MFPFIDFQFECITPKASAQVRETARNTCGCNKAAAVKKYRMTAHFFHIDLAHALYAQAP
ncbi:MAG TPA: hypothetical protein DCY10_08285 [Clostridiales bacterium]|nr:hypothetical protein [Clostridiales bacterium]